MVTINLRLFVKNSDTELRFRNFYLSVLYVNEAIAGGLDVSTFRSTFLCLTLIHDLIISFLVTIILYQTLFFIMGFLNIM